MPISKRLRAIAMSAGLWGAAFGLGSVVLSVWAFLRAYLQYGQLFSAPATVTMLFRNLATLGVGGAVLGAGFAILLTVLERERTFGELTIGRAVRWGMVSGLALAGVLAILDPAANPPLFFVGSATIGGLGAMGMLLLARRASADGSSSSSLGMAPTHPALPGTSSVAEHPGRIGLFHRVVSAMRRDADRTP